MFGLPTATVVIIFGIPAIWVIYTLVFVYLSRRWKAEDVAEDEELTARNSRGPNTPDRSVDLGQRERGTGMNIETWSLVIYFAAMAGIGVWTLKTGTKGSDFLLATHLDRPCSNIRSIRAQHLCRFAHPPAEHDRLSTPPPMSPIAYQREKEPLV